MAGFIFRKGTFGTGGPSRVRSAPSTFTPRQPDYIYLEDNSDFLYTEDGDPLITD
jgi:hypothetical protein